MVVVLECEVCYQVRVVGVYDFMGQIANSRSQLIDHTILLRCNKMLYISRSSTTSLCLDG